MSNLGDKSNKIQFNRTTQLFLTTGLITDDFDASKLTLHMAKRQEMDTQIRVLELEKELEQHRLKLAALRKQHYQLAGESEGWVS